MPLLPPNEVESELSYAYLHAVAASAGMEACVLGRHADKLGIDAAVTANDDFGEGAVLTDITLHVQLKATIAAPKVEDENIKYTFKGIDRYNKLRRETVAPPRILVVLFLPESAEEWLQWSEERLAIQKCAWWVSLRGAPETENETSLTVLLPQAQSFSPQGLKEIMSRLAREEEINYHG